MSLLQSLFNLLRSSFWLCQLLELNFVKITDELQSYQIQWSRSVLILFEVSTSWGYVDYFLLFETLSFLGFHDFFLWLYSDLTDYASLTSLAGAFSSTKHGSVDVLQSLEWAPLLCLSKVSSSLISSSSMYLNVTFTQIPPVFISSILTSPMSSRLINPIVYLKLPFAGVSNQVNPERCSWYLFPNSSAYICHKSSQFKFYKILCYPLLFLVMAYIIFWD